MSRPPKNDRVPIIQGRNRWILTRTDRDAASREDVIQTAGAFLSKKLSEVSPAGTQELMVTPLEIPSPNTLATFLGGAARPIDIVYASQDLPPRALFNGRVMATARGQAPVRQLNPETTQNPWFIVADFDWRAPDVFANWPAYRVNALGWRSLGPPNQLDWYLVESRILPKSEQTPDTDRSDAFADKAEELAEKAKEIAGNALNIGKGAGVAVAVLSLPLLVYLFRRKKAE